MSLWIVVTLAAAPVLTLLVMPGRPAARVLLTGALVASVLNATASLTQRREEMVIRKAMQSAPGSQDLHLLYAKAHATNSCV